MVAMKLLAWLKDTGTSQAAIGRKVGLTQGRISQIADRGTIDVRTARAIAEATGGAVTADELLMDRPAARAEARAAG